MCGKQQEATAPIQSLVKLQPSFPSLRRKSCLRQNCSLGSRACSEEPVLGQKTLMIYISKSCVEVDAVVLEEMVFELNKFSISGIRQL